MRIFKWDRFLVLKNLDILYYMSLALVALSLIGCLVAFFDSNFLARLGFGGQLFLFIFIILSHMLLAALFRALFEFLLVVYRMNDTLDAIRRAKGA